MSGASDAQLRSGMRFASSSSTIAPPAGSSSEDLRKAAQAFEAIFLRQLLSSARAADFGGEDLIGGPGVEQFEAMRDEHFADVASRQGVFLLRVATGSQTAGDSLFADVWVVTLCHVLPVVVAVRCPDRASWDRPSAS